MTPGLGNPAQGPVRLTVAIMHAPWDKQRAGWVMDTRLQLQREAKAMEREGGHPGRLLRVSVVRDDKRQGVWPTARRAWGDAIRTPAGTHHLVLQDDTKLCGKAFLPAVIQAIYLRPKAPISFFSMRGVVVRAVQAGATWMTSNDGFWGNSSLLPTDLVYDFLRWESRHVRPDCPWDDSRMSLWAMATKRRCWTPLPCLVDHLAPGDSLVGNSNRKRVAAAFLGDRDWREIDWTAGVGSPIHDPSRNSGIRKWLVTKPTNG